MEIRQLEAFAAVMSTGSVTGAARLLQRSQPAVTRLVHELEAAAGYPLFTRHGPRVAPTQEGFLLYEEVEHLLGGWRRLQARSAEIAQGGGAEPLLLAATSAVALGLLPQALRQLERDAGPMPVRLQSGSPERVLRDVVGGAVQLGVSSLPLEHRGLQVLWIGQAPCVAVLADGDPLAAAASVPLAALAGRRLVTLSNPYRLRHRIDTVLAGSPAAPVIETNASANAQALVRAGLGIAILDPLTAHGAPLQGVQARPLEADIPFFFGVIAPQGRPLAPRLQALAEALREAARSLPGFVEHPPAAHAELLQAAAPATPAAQP